MKPVSPVLPGYEVVKVVFAKDQPEYMQLPAVRVESPERQVLTRWQLSEEDRQKIAAGADVYLWVSTFGQPLQPVAVEVTTAKEIMDRGSSGQPQDDVLNASIIG
jgi:hypothetical protein